MPLLISIISFALLSIMTSASAVAGVSAAPVKKITTSVSAHISEVTRLPKLASVSELAPQTLRLPNLKEAARQKAIFQKANTPLTPKYQKQLDANVPLSSSQIAKMQKHHQNQLPGFQYHGFDPELRMDLFTEVKNGIPVYIPRSPHVPVPLKRGEALKPGNMLYDMVAEHYPVVSMRRTRKPFTPPPAYSLLTLRQERQLVEAGLQLKPKYIEQLRSGKLLNWRQVQSFYRQLNPHSDPIVASFEKHLNKLLDDTMSLRYATLGSVAEKQKALADELSKVFVRSMGNYAFEVTRPNHLAALRTMLGRSTKTRTPQEVIDDFKRQGMVLSQKTEARLLGGELPSLKTFDAKEIAAYKTGDLPVANQMGYPEIQKLVEKLLPF